MPTQRKKYKTIIIGGGPAGFAVGLTLLKNQQDCCILEKETYPRKKLCGGLLTPKTIEQLKILGLSKEFAQLSSYQTNYFEIYHQKKKMLSLATNLNFTSVDRMEFDDMLARFYKKQGGLLKEGESVISIDLKRHLVKTQKQEYEYENLVGADGAMGITRKYLKKKKIRYAFCLELTKKQEKETTTAIQIDTGILSKGYAWTFPKKGGVCLGLGGVDYKEKDYLNDFKTYFKEKIQNEEENKIRGAFVPFGKCDRKVFQKEGNLFLVGDCAGLIDVVTGEGIYYALKSGIFLGESILEAKDHTEKIPKYYKQKLKKMIRGTNRSNQVANLFYRHRKFFYWFVKKFPSLFLFFTENQILQDSYHYGIFKFLSAYIRRNR